MKSIFFTLIICLSVNIYSQTNISSISNDAILIFDVKNSNILKKLPKKVIEQSPIFSLFQKEVFGDRSNATLDDLGIDMNKDFVFAVENTKDFMFFIGLYALDNKKKFESFLKQSPDFKNGEIIEGKKYTYFKWKYGRDILAWNKKQLVFLDGEYIGNEFKYEYDYKAYRTRSRKVDEVMDLYLENNDIQKSISIVEVKYKKIEQAKSKEDAAANAIEEVTYDKAYTKRDYTEDYYDKKNQVRDYFEKENRKKEDERRNKREQLTIDGVNTRLASFFMKSKNNNSIVNNKELANRMNDKADAFYWSKNGLYAPLLSGFRSYRRLTGASRGKDMQLLNNTGNTYSNMFLENDKIRTEIEMTYGDSVIKYIAPVLSTRLNPELLNYIPDNSIAYWTYSQSTENMLHAMPYLYKRSYQSVMPRYAQVIDVTADVMKILLDEEDAAKMFPGDIVFALTGMSEKEVTYTRYEYDENYNRKEVEKTKKEIFPDFRFVAACEYGTIVDKLFKLGVKEKELDKLGEIYVTKESRDLPFKLYMSYKNGRFFMGTTEDDLKKMISGRVKTGVSSEEKQTILNNSNVIYYNNQKMMSSIPMENIRRTKEREMLQYFIDNSRDASWTQHFSNGEMKAEMIVNIPEGEQNSATYLFDFFNDMYQIDSGKR